MDIWWKTWIFWRKFQFLMKISIFDENFDFWSKFGFCLWNKKFYKHLDIWWKTWIFWRKFQFLMKISIFDENFDFWWKFRFLMKISNFYKKIIIFDRFLRSNIILFSLAFYPFFRRLTLLFSICKSNSKSHLVGAWHQMRLCRIDELFWNWKFGKTAISRDPSKARIN